MLVGSFDHHLAVPCGFRQVFSQKKKRIMLLQKLGAEQNKNENRVKFWDLFKRPLMKLMTINVLVSWFSVSLVFYGLILNAGKLSGKREPTKILYSLSITPIRVDILVNDTK